MTNDRKKPGKLSLDEEAFIRANATTMDLEGIAAALNRNVAPVKRYMAEQGLLGSNTTDEATIILLRKRLKNRPYYPEIVKQLANDDEMMYVEKIWIGLMQQFKEDVTVTEELSIKQLVMLDVFINRALAETKRYVEELDKTETLINDEYKLDISIRNTALLAVLESKAIQLRNAIGSHNNNYIKLLDKFQAILKDMKATREQRFAKLIEGKSSWIGLLRTLDNAEIREKEGEEMELMKLAAKKSKEDLSELHTYVDGSVDSPFLSYETIKED